MGKISIFQRLGAAALILGILSPTIAKSAAEVTQPSPYQEWFAPAIGFKPAQANFQKILLQLAGSLEYYGSPEPYLRHVVAEEARIGELYHKATGRTGSGRPAYFTDGYLENLVAGWNKLAPPLKLDDLCRQAGRDIRYAIMGGWNKSVPELVVDETTLSDEEQQAYRALLHKQYFTKADFPAMEAFYKSTYDKLTEDGKSQISERTRRGQLSPELRAQAIEAFKGGTVLIRILGNHQDSTAAYLESSKAGVVNSDNLQMALISRLKLGQEIGDISRLPAKESDPLLYSHEIQEAFEKRFAFIKKRQSPEQAKDTIFVMISMLENIVVIAHSEFVAAMLESSAKLKH